MNETECESLIKSVKWTEPASLISLAILEFINVLVIGGNCLVIAAVFCSNKLRSVTNFFIVNLAVADLLVGLAVLPFSATWEVFKVWIFGDVWCRIWLAVDVWMCTASILNLCAISLDRYVAVTRPVTYPSIMSTKKAKSLIAGIWVLSFVICFPPLVGWKDQKPEVQPTYTRGNYTLYYATTTTKTTTSTTTKTSRITTNSSSNIYTLEPLKESEKQQTHENKIALLLSSSDESKENNNINKDNNNNNNHLSYNPYDPYTYSSIDFDVDADTDAAGVDVGAAPAILFTTTSAGLTTQPTTTTIAEDSNSSKNNNSNSKSTFNDQDVTTITISGPPAPPCPWKCELTNDRGYVLYSALGSFYIPMFVMLFFYWRIYRAAVRTTRAINQGFKTTKGSSPRDVGSGSSNRVDESQIILRMHRGRPSNTTRQNLLSTHSMSSALSVNSNSEDALPLQNCGGSMMFAPKRAASMRINRQRHEKVSIKVSFPSSENVLDSSNSIASSPPHYALVAATTSSSLSKSTLSNGRRTSFKSSLFEIGETTFNLDSNTAEGGISAVGNYGGDAGSGAGSGCASETIGRPLKESKKRSGKRAHKFQVKRFRMETKAAKTLAIIVGGFIVCWLPFFTMYLIRAFCEQCIQPTVFSVLFWLGYCNSAINPLIYALFSHEFRVAFKRILFRCVCTRSGFRASENFQMVAARALMAPATFHKTISGCSDDGDGPDFS